LTDEKSKVSDKVDTKADPNKDSGYQTPGHSPLAGPTGAKDPVSEPPKAATSAKNLIPGAESSDPSIQYLLAERQTAQLNRNALADPSKDEINALDAELDRINKELAARGYK
jgi:hypothetical protein